MIWTDALFIPGTRTTVALPLNVARFPCTLSEPFVTGPSTVMTLSPLNPPVSGPAMLQTNVPPAIVTANPKSDAELIVLPAMGCSIRPAPSCGFDGHASFLHDAKLGMIIHHQPPFHARARRHNQAPVLDRDYPGKAGRTEMGDDLVRDLARDFQSCPVLGRRLTDQEIGRASCRER